MAKQLGQKKHATSKDIETRARQKAREIAKSAAESARIAKARQQKGTSAARAMEELRRTDELVNQYMPYAASIASRVCQSLSSAVDYEDVLCNARLGLIEAAKRFDVEQEVDFKTFAYYRIKGAIYDGLRRSGWLPRTLYAKIKFEEAANDLLQQKAIAKRAAGLAQSASAPSADLEENAVAETVNSLASIYIISLDANEDSDVEDENGTNVEQRTEFMQVRRHMRDAIGTLPDKEKQLIMMYYFQNRTLEEIGERLGLSKSWTSRLHARALALLFKRIRGRAGQSKEGEGENEEQI